MGTYNQKHPTVWLRSIRHHTYEGVAQPEGAFYLAHDEMVETICDVLRFAVRDAAPRRAVRAVVPAPAPIREPIPAPLPSHAADDVATDTPAEPAEAPASRRRR